MVKYKAHKRYVTHEVKDATDTSTYIDLPVGFYTSIYIQFRTSQHTGTYLVTLRDKLTQENFIYFTPKLTPSSNDTGELYLLENIYIDYNTELRLTPNDTYATDSHYIYIYATEKIGGD